jgi:nucleotide-binding universal stress UspA family protein
MPVTVLNLTRKEGGGNGRPPPPAPEPASADDGKDAVERVRESGSTGAATAQETDETRGDAVLVGTRVEPDDLPRTLAAEAEKGHDLLYVGAEPLIADEGGFEPRIEAMLAAFRKTAAIVSARGELRRNPETPLRLLVPVNGDAWSMRAVEFAVMLAKASGAKVSALYVRADKPAQQARQPRRGEAEPLHVAVFEQVREIGRHYEVEVRTIVQDGMEPELSILQQARRGRHNLIILGVGRRAGERLSFGAVAGTLLETSDRSLVFFATG